MIFGPQYRYDYISKVIRNTFWTDVLSHFQIVQLSTDEKSESLIGKKTISAHRGTDSDISAIDRGQTDRVTA